ncbi:DUF5106 domain-containing protein [Sphingobacterium lactis]|uniref:DUF5106 domain-containing protein n=1 Tax=Sphingobacterium lactis TaxID=797291 RepID=UPI003DA69C9F
MFKLLTVVLILLMAMLGTSCTNGNIAERTTSPNVPKTENLLKAKSWANFDFRTRSNWQNPEIGEQKMVDFLASISLLESNRQQNEFTYFLKKASTNKEALTYFEKTITRYLNDPNSPLYNVESYLSFLRAYLKSGLLSGNNKEIHNSLLQQLARNEIGKKAIDFQFTLSDRHIQKLSDYKANYFILFFYDPMCQHCQESIHALRKDKNINRLLESSNSKLFMINPWGNDEKWRHQQQFFPKEWISGITNPTFLQEGNYHLPAAPSVFLLDGNFRFLLRNKQMHNVISYIKNT